MKKVYLSGPITGVPEQNIPMFRRVRDAIERDYVGEVTEVILPHEIPPYDHDGECPEAKDYPSVTGSGHNGYCHLRGDIIDMLQCDTVVMLPGWFESRGANLEHHIATRLRMPVYYWNDTREGLASHGY